MKRQRARTVLSALVFGAVIASSTVSSSEAWAGPSPGEPQQGLYLLDPTAAAPTLVVAGEEDDPAWSPEGGSLVAFDTDDYSFNVINVQSGSRHRVESFAWSHSGSRVAYSAKSSRSSTRLFVASSGWSKPRLVTRSAGSDPLAWAPDDRRFVYGSGRQSCCWRSLVVVRGDGTHPRTVLKKHAPLSVSWSPTGKLLAAMDYDMHLYVVPAAGGRARKLPGTWESWPDPEWSPDGKSIFLYPAQGSSRTGGFDAVRLNVAGGPARVVCEGCYSFGFSPDRRSIAFIDSQGALWTEHPDGSGKRLVASAAFESQWSPDSQHLVFSTFGVDDESTTIALADLATGEVRNLTDGGHLDRPYDGLSADGRFVAFERFGEPTGHELWIVGSDGTGARKVISYGTCSLTSWAPRGALLAITNLDDC